ncbi:MAG: hypothetical protein M1377_05835 [Deltaproteobacteria bacterium]|nr:hypothetical protein [Deltaproteobacteria bacterium]
MTPPNPHQFERRRAEDVFRAMEEDVFPRLGAIDTKIVSLEQGVQRLMVEGCAHREGDLQRTRSVEESMGRIFEKIDSFGTELSEARVDLVAQVGVIKTDMAKQIGGIRTWVLTGIVVALLGLLVYFAKDYAHDIEQHVGKAPAAIGAQK